MISSQFMRCSLLAQKEMDAKAVAHLEDSQKVIDEKDWKVGLDAGDKIRLCMQCARTGGAMQSTCYRCKLLVTSADAAEH